MNARMFMAAAAILAATRQVSGGSAAVAVVYENALRAAFHKFVEDGDLDYVAAMAARHPHLVNAPQRFREPRKPRPADSYTPLHRAVCSNQMKVAEYLLSKNADPNAADAFGWTPLHLAAKNGDIGMVKLLVHYRANVWARTRAWQPSDGAGVAGFLPGDRRIPGAPNNPPPKLAPLRIPPYTPAEIARKHGRLMVARYLDSVVKKTAP